MAPKCARTKSSRLFESSPISQRHKEKAVASKRTDKLYSVGTPIALVPLLVLIEFVSYLARAFSLGIRLFANVVAGHTLMKILSTFLYKMFAAGLVMFVVTLLPFGLFLAIMGLELAVSFIQAYVFTILTCSYIRDAVNLH